MVKITEGKIKVSKILFSAILQIHTCQVLVSIVSGKEVTVIGVSTLTTNYMVWKHQTVMPINALLYYTAGKIYQMMRCIQEVVQKVGDVPLFRMIL